MIGAVLAVILPATASGQFPEIELGWVRPTVGQVGTQFEITVGGGNHLDQVGRLVFSDPRITAELITAPGEGADAAPVPQWGRFKVSLPADLAPGRYEVHAVGAYGFSNPRVFCVTPHAIVTAPAVGKSAATATTPEPPPAADTPWIFETRSTAAAVDFFRISGSATRARRVSLVAQGIDSRMIGQIKLYSADGKLLDTARGADSHDPSLLIPAGADGQFVLAVQDFLFRGGDPFFYQLRVDADDFRPAPVEGAAKGVDSPELAWLASVAGEPVVPPPTAAVGDAAVTQVPYFDDLEAVTLGSVLSGATLPIPLALSETPEQPVVVQPPCLVASRFSKPKFGLSLSQVVFQFDAVKDRKLQIEVISQRLGQPADPSLTIQRREALPEGGEKWVDVSSANESPLLGDFAMRLRVKDPIVLFTAPSDGTYRLRVRNLDTGSTLTSTPIYLISVRDPEPDYRLVAMFPFPHNDAANTRPRGAQVMRGDSRTIRVLAFRNGGFGDAIELTVEGLPEGVTCKPAMIAANQTEAHLTLVGSEQATAWTGSLRVVGKSGELVRPAAAATVIWGRGDLRDTVSTRLCTALPLAAADQVTTPVSIVLGADQPLVAKPGTNVSVPVKLTRRDGGGNPVVLRPRNLPPGVTVAEVTIAADQSEGAVEFKIAADAKLGNYTPWLLAETKVKFKPITAADPAEMTVFIPTNAANLNLADSP